MTTWTGPAPQDVLLASNAHTQHDLPFVYEEMGAVEMVKGWREGAWRNGERLLAARTPAQRERVKRSIELTSRLWADAIVAETMPGHREVRDAHCRGRGF